jgi:antirestriction protein ArdC
MTNADVYAKATAAIVEQLKQGVAPWSRPWSAVEPGMGMPRNAVSRRAYSGVNVFTLMTAQWARGYETAGWLTFKQALKVGAIVRRGEKSSPVVWFKQLRKKDPTTGEEEVIWLARLYYVFNLDQLDDHKVEGSVERLKARFRRPAGAETVGEPERLDEAELLALSSGIPVSYGGDRACYIPALDRIEMPPRRAFPDPQALYPVLFHELVHGTGHETRLDRGLMKKVDGDTYAREELIAELGSTFLCAVIGMDHVSRASTYLASWLSRLQDPDGSKWLAGAATKATEAANWRLSEAGIEYQPAEGSEEEESEEALSASV